MNDKSTLTQEQRRELSKRKVTIEVSLLEQELLFQLRKLSHGKFTIQILDGIPFRYELNSSHFFEGGAEFDILKKE